MSPDPFGNALDRVGQAEGKVPPSAATLVRGLFGRQAAWRCLWRRMAERVAALLKLSPKSAPGPVWTLTSLTELVRTGAADGVVHPNAADIASRALLFGRLRVHDVMVPRNRIKAVPLRATPAELKRILLEEGHARMPVFDRTLDTIAGILVARDVLALAWEQSLVVLDDLLQPPYFAPQMMHAADLLKELQRRRMHFAIVVDELGGTAGIVTLEDLLEELVGDIYGEHDRSAPELVHHEADGSLTLEGVMPVREANRELALALPEGDGFTTIGGLCVRLAGRIPEAGQRFEARRGLIFEVIEASPRMVTRVRVQHSTRLSPAPPAPASPTWH